MAALGRSQDRNCWAFWWDQRDLTCKIFHFTNGLIIETMDFSAAKGGWFYYPTLIGITPANR